MGISDLSRCIMHILGMHDAHGGWWGYIVRPYSIAWVDNFYAGAKGVQPDQANDLNTMAIAITRMPVLFPYFHGQPVPA